MLPLFLIIILAGAGLFVVVLRKELKGGSGGDTADRNGVHLRSVFDPASSAASQGVLSSVFKSDDRTGITAMKKAAGEELEQKCIKLEQILEEKNRALARLEDDLKSEQAHRGEFETLKDILQTQIEDLKGQNRKMKDELSKVLQENLELQSRSLGAGKPAEPSIVRAEDPVAPKSEFDTFFGTKEESSGGAPFLSLNDVFAPKKEDGKGE